MQERCKEERERNFMNSLPLLWIFRFSFLSLTPVFLCEPPCLCVSSVSGWWNSLVKTSSVYSHRNSLSGQSVYLV